LSLPDVGYAALRLAAQPLHRRSVHPGPLVLGTAPVKLPTPTADRDRTVSRVSFPDYSAHSVYLHPRSGSCRVITAVDLPVVPAVAGDLGSQKASVVTGTRTPLLSRSRSTHAASRCLRLE